MGYSRQMLKKMNAERETSFRPRLWNNQNQPLTKEMLAQAKENADKAQYLEDNKEREISFGELPAGAVVISEEEEAEMLENCEDCTDEKV